MTWWITKPRHREWLIGLVGNVWPTSWSSWLSAHSLLDARLLGADNRAIHPQVQIGPLTAQGILAAVHRPSNGSIRFRFEHQICRQETGCSEIVWVPERLAQNLEAPWSDYMVFGERNTTSVKTHNTYFCHGFVPRNSRRATVRPSCVRRITQLFVYMFANRDHVFCRNCMRNIQPR